MSKWYILCTVMQEPASKTRFLSLASQGSIRKDSFWGQRCFPFTVL